MSFSPPRLRKVLVLVGPTAAGKTAISLEVAPRLDAEIISSDSRQVYRYLDIGTAKPSPVDLAKVRHYFVDELLPEEDFNAGEFGKRGRTIVDDIFGRKKVPMVVGGSGLYVRALVDGFFDGPSADTEVRRLLYRRLHAEGSAVLLEELRSIDPAAAGRMLPSNTRRIIRALEVYQLTSTPISEMHKSHPVIPFQPVLVGLEWDRKKLYSRINRRVDDMIKSGLIEEVRSLVAKGYGPTQNALMTTGYVETFEYLKGKIDLAQLVELIKRNTRRYAKRQLTWFRPDERIRWFRLESEEEFEDVASEIIGHFRQS